MISFRTTVAAVFLSRQEKGGIPGGREPVQFQRLKETAARHIYYLFT